MESTLAILERRWQWALGALMLLDLVLLLHMGRHLTFFYDDWDYVTHDYGGGIHSLLTPHNGHLSVVPIALYKLLFHAVGLNHYAVFRLVLIALHLSCAGLVFVLASRRVTHVQALLAAALILFLGAAWEDLVWAFQIDYMLSIAAGLASWVLLEREGRGVEIALLLCMLVALGSSSLGIAVVVGVAAEIACRRRWRVAWVVIVPLALYALWYLGYGESEITRNGLIDAPGYAEDLFAAAFGGLMGRGLEWGRPLAVLGIGVGCWRLIRVSALTPRLIGLLATGLSLWFITAAARSTVSPPEASRYIYLGAVVIVLVAVELIQGILIVPRATALAAVLVAIAAITGLTPLHAGAKGLREVSQPLTAELGALELAASHAPPDYRPDAQRAPQILAGPYLHTVRSIGSSPADSPSEIAAASTTSRAAADAVLLTLDAPILKPLGPIEPPQATSPPRTFLLTGATQSGRGSCVRLTPGAGAATTADLELPTLHAVIRDEGRAPAAVGLKRFGDGFVPLATPAGPHSVSLLSLPADDAVRVPWQLQIVSPSRVSICALGS